MGYGVLNEAGKFIYQTVVDPLWAIDLQEHLGKVNPVIQYTNVD